MIARIAVEIRGGLVTRVVANDNDVEIIVVDYDAEGSDDDTPGMFTDREGCRAVLSSVEVEPMTTGDIWPWDAVFETDAAGVYQDAKEGGDL